VPQALLITCAYHSPPVTCSSERGKKKEREKKKKERRICTSRTCSPHFDVLLRRARGEGGRKKKEGSWALIVNDRLQVSSRPEPLRRGERRIRSQMALLYLLAPACSRSREGERALHYPSRRWKKGGKEEREKKEKRSPARRLR